MQKLLAITADIKMMDTDICSDVIADATSDPTLALGLVDAEHACESNSNGAAISGGIDALPTSTDPADVGSKAISKERVRNACFG